MLTYLLRRLLSAVVLLFTISTLTFFLIYSSGSNTARTILGESATDQQVLAKAHELGLDQPIMSRYWSWLSSAATGNLGTSWFTSEPVAYSLETRLPITLSLVVTATVFAAVCATALAMVAAVRRGWLDKALQVLSVLGFAIPSFIVAIFLISTFAINLQIFPATGYVPATENPRQWAVSLALPILALLVATVASSASQLRSAIIDVMQRDFVRTLKARGLPTREIMFRHVLRSAAPAALTVLSLQFVALLSGSVVIEQMFALPGIGSLAVNSTTRGDLPVVMGVTVYTVIVVIIVNTIADLLAAWLNPKVRSTL